MKRIGPHSQATSRNTVKNKKFSRKAFVLSTLLVTFGFASTAAAADYVIDLRGVPGAYYGIIVDRDTGEAVRTTEENPRKRKGKALKDAHEVAEQMEAESDGDGEVQVVDTCLFYPDTCPQ